MVLDWNRTGLVYFLELGEAGRVMDSIHSSTAKLVITSLMVLS